MKDFKLKPFHEMNFFTVLILRTLFLPLGAFVEITAVVFITMKVTAVITWPWLVVLIPAVVSLVTGTVMARYKEKQEEIENQARPMIPTESLSVKLMH